MPLRFPEYYTVCILEYIYKNALHVLHSTHFVQVHVHPTIGMNIKAKSL